MNRNKNKNQYGTFHIGKSRYKRTALILVTALTVVFFVLGIGFWKHKSHQPIKAAETQSTASAIPGWWYQQYFGKSVCDNPVCQPDADPDHDGLTNAQEFYYHTDPLNAHTMKDKLSDGQLVAAGFDPSR